MQECWPDEYFSKSQSFAIFDSTHIWQQDHINYQKVTSKKNKSFGKLSDEEWNFQ